MNCTDRNLPTNAWWNTQKPASVSPGPHFRHDDSHTDSQGENIASRDCRSWYQALTDEPFFSIWVKIGSPAPVLLGSPRWADGQRNKTRIKYGRREIKSLPSPALQGVSHLLSSDFKAGCNKSLIEKEVVFFVFFLQCMDRSNFPSDRQLNSDPCLCVSVCVLTPCLLISKPP